MIRTSPTVPGRRCVSIALLAILAHCALPAMGHASSASLRFDGAQALTLPPIPLGSHTIELWMKPNGELPLGTVGPAVFDWDGRVVVRNSLAGLDYTVDLEGLGPQRLAIAPVQPGQWHHAALSYDGAQMRIFLDGKPAAAKAIPGRIVRTGESGLALLGSPIGSPKGSVPFTGNLDELRVWDHPRTLEEIDNLYDDHLGGKEPGLLGYWDLDEGSGQAAGDLAAGRTAILGATGQPDTRDPAWSTDAAGVRTPAPGLSFGFDPPGPLNVHSGELIPVACTLTTLPGAAGSGVTAWSIAVRHDRARLRIDDIILASTAADLRKADGFAKVELVDNGTVAGFISQVVLSAAGGTALPPALTQVIARARYRGILDYTAAARVLIHYDDRIPPAPALAARLEVSAGSTVKLPSAGALTLQMLSPRFTLAIDPAQANVVPGSEFEGLIYLATEDNRIDTGAIGWSMSVHHDPAVLDLLEVTTAGTYLDSFQAEELFRVNEMVANDSGTGFISVAILNFSGPRSLPGNGRFSVARVRYRMRSDAGIGTETTAVFVSGLRGSGVPIENQVSFPGGIQVPAFEGLAARAVSGAFVRGNVNGDGMVNLADVIYILNCLYRAGPEIRCLDAADANDDGKINVADPAWIINALYRSGSPGIPAPFPTAGGDPTPDDRLDCAEWP